MSESEAPIVIGVLELALALALELVLVLVLVVLLLLELLLQAARTLIDSTAAPRPKARMGSQGRLGLTPGSSFLLVPSSLVNLMSALIGGIEPVGHVRVLADKGQPGRLCLLLQQRGEIGIAVAASD